MTYTISDLELEYHVSKQTRLGMLCDDRCPTLEQESIAHMEAQAHVKRLRSSTVGIQQLIDFGKSL